MVLIILYCVRRLESRREAVTHFFDFSAFGLISQNPVLDKVHSLDLINSFIPYFFFQYRFGEDI